jgi:hypothetical protein
LIYTCAHSPPHTGRLSSCSREVAWRDFLREKGWLDAGCCYHFYPEWLRTTWENNIFISVNDFDQFKLSTLAIDVSYGQSGQFSSKLLSSGAFYANT